MELETVIGLEVHAQLLTRSKIFCTCTTEFGRAPNESACPICLGMPGVLPVLNRTVVEFAMKLGLAVHATVARSCRFARKNYFYPDLPKGYQISQFEQPLCVGGHIDIQPNGGSKRIGLTRIHMEEDAGKLIHGENLGDPNSSYVDLNRAGIPLVEIVSEPDLSSPEEARAYLLKLKSLLQYLEVCDGNMEEGSLRCDANISLRPKGATALGTKTEIKNMNSFRNVQRALEYEIERQRAILSGGGTIHQETRLWDATQGVTLPMRSKEHAHDYRYFPEPDLVPLVVDEAWIVAVRATIPELPDEKRQRFERDYGLPAYDAEVLTTSRPLADYFETAARRYPKPKVVSNWVMGELLGALNRSGKEIGACPIAPENLAELLQLIDAGTISGKIAKTVFEEMFETSASPRAIVAEKGLTQISDSSAVERVVDEVIAANPEQLMQYRAGRTKLLGFFVGQVMKATHGKANPQLVNDLLREKLR
ncbi:MAG: Asp-tRNA(Asn)/Glu-tRNA(Gln) amidotransferase subunit GatB [Candidatus Tectomicrobia bacterium]|nr:Asp-tRNA(Asn)/Glu-tRNA(Gln) amidotransferase subunit GatB [Candidatus Tectomicrobia bacterium]